MGEATAIPDNLHTYAQATTDLETTLQTLVRTSLTPALQAYQASSTDFGSGIACVTPSGPAPGGGSLVDAQVLSLLADLLKTDQWVHDVGTAFQNAGGAPPPGSTPWQRGGQGLPQHDPLASQPVTTDDDTIIFQVAYVESDAADQQHFLDGQALARRLNAQDPWTDPALDGVLRELGGHVGDDDYAAGFWSCLNQEQIIAILRNHLQPPDLQGQGVTDPIALSLTEAYHSPFIGEDFTAMVLQAFPATGPRGVTPLGAQQEILQYLIADPTADARFFATAPRALLVDRLGRAALLDVFLQAATAAEGAVTSADQAQSILDETLDVLRVTGARPTDVSDRLSALLKAAAAAEVPSLPSGAGPGDLSQWSHNLGAAAERILKPFTDWATRTDNQDAQVQQWVNIFVGVGITLLTAAFPWFVGGFAGTVASVIELLEPSFNAQQDSDALTQRMAYAAQTLALVALIGNGDVVQQKEPRGPYLEVGNMTPESIAAILKKDDLWEQYKIKGSNDLDISLILNNAAAPVWQPSSGGA